MDHAIKFNGVVLLFMICWEDCAIDLQTTKMQTIINNYWARLSKILLLVSGEQINYLLKAEANNWSPRQWQITIFCNITKFNNNYCFIIRSPFFQSTKYVKSLSACSGNWSTIFTQEHRFNYAWTEYYLRQNSHLQAIMCRSCGVLLVNEKEGKNTLNDNNCCKHRLFLCFCW